MLESINRAFLHLLQYVCGTPSVLKIFFQIMFLVMRVSPHYQVFSCETCAEVGHISTNTADQVPRSDLNLSAGIV